MQETAENSNRLKNSLLKDTQVKQENIKIHGIGLDKAGRCTHYHTQLDIAALLCAKCRKYYACYSCHDELEDHPFAPTTPEEAYPVSQAAEYKVTCRPGLIPMLYENGKFKPNHNYQAK